MRSLITFTTRKFPLIHMMMLLSLQERITDHIHGIHKHEMFECITSLGHCQGKVLWIQEGCQDQESCQAEGHWDTKDKPFPLVQGNSSLLHISQPGRVFKHFQHGGDNLRAQIFGLSSTSTSNMTLQ